MAGSSRGSARAAIRAQIDENLKRVYHAALEEELPDRFKTLLARLSDPAAPQNPSRTSAQSAEQNGSAATPDTEQSEAEAHRLAWAKAAKDAV